jgi:hypothetical protein
VFHAIQHLREDYGRSSVSFPNSNSYYYKLANCRYVSAKEENRKDRMDGMHSRRSPKNFSPFWELIKINITRQIEVKTGLYLHRFNSFRSDTIPYQDFTNDQDEVETINRYSTRVNLQVGELRIRRENDGLSRDYI